ncbi:MAG: serine/threonine-protein kinase [Methanoregula sp.]|nr:serine/threonine-protein kinase [Methanoregula sp.]
MTSSNFSLKANETLYKYRLIEKIGNGGFGQVWLAKDVAIDQNVAVKVLDSSMSSVAENLNEAKIGSNLNHKNLVKVQYADVVAYNGQEFVIIAMDFFERGSIVNKLNSDGFLPIIEAIKYLEGVLSGLEYLHERKIIHGDIKPQNILISSMDTGVLTDYGISCQFYTSGPVPLKNAYNLHIAPEAIGTGRISVQTDIYQIGITLFRLLNGVDCFQQIYDDNGQEKYEELVCKGKLAQQIPYQTFIPRSLKSIINKAIDVDPSKRFQTAVEMRRALERLRFHGYWTINSKGDSVGINGDYFFRYEIHSTDGILFDISAYKKNSLTSRETRVQRFCIKHAKKDEANDAIKKFMRYVVTDDAGKRSKHN